MSQSLKRTPLADEHTALGARLVDFGGWSMPVQYTGVMQEHLTVRQKVGLFDVSHMGEIRVLGKAAVDFLNYLTTNDVTKLEDGQAQYTVMTYPEGTVVDDLLVYRVDERDLLLVVNAACRQKDFDWIRRHAADWDVTIRDESEATALLALQGPLAERVLVPLADGDVTSLAYYRFQNTEIDKMPVLVSRTGYTGEDGFECYLAAEFAVRLWRLLLEKGREAGILPAGLGARDTLRLEARMNLYGNDMDHTTTALEAGLGWAVKLKKTGPFIGKEALKAQKKSGLARKLVGFEMTEKGIARHGYPILVGDREVGYVTSGSHAPSLNKAIGMGYVPIEAAEPGTEIDIGIRNKTAAAVVVKGPFYKRNQGSID